MFAILFPAWKKILEDALKTTFHPLYFIIGATATGKTHLSIYLAERLKAVVLNCDSIAMYKNLDIGSDKPKLYPYKCVNNSSKSSYYLLGQSQTPIPAFLFNEWEPPSICTAGAFRKKAISILERELLSRSALAVGGSGFYIQALEKGMYPIQPISQKIKDQVTQIKNNRGTEHLYKLLQFLDSKYAQHISPKDSYRVERAIHIILSEEKPLSDLKSLFKEQKLPFPYLKIGLYLPKEIAFKKIQSRIEKMLKKGFIEEVQDLLKKGLADWPIMNSVGYKEAMLFLQNKISMEELKEHTLNRTMKLFKKQNAWLKRDKKIKWHLSTPDNWEIIFHQIKQQSLHY